MKSTFSWTKALVLLAVVVCVFGGTVFGQPWDGNGTPNDPYQIWDACDMQAIGADSNYWGECFKLMADIDLANYPSGFVTPIGWGVDWASEDMPFTGVFDGNGHSIFGWSYICDNEDSGYIGLFGYINDANAEVRNLHLIKPRVSRVGWVPSSAGALVGYMENGSIYDCHIQDANIGWRDTVGALVGQNGGNVTNCSVSGKISGRCEVAGLVGYNERSGVISQCSASANVTSTATGSGGFVALNKGEISSSHFIGTVTGVWQVGGFASSNSYGQILESFAIAEVNGYRYVSGFASINRTYNYLGTIRKGIIKNCYAQGSVTGDRWVGGLVGKNYRGTHIDSYSASQVQWTGTEIGGLIGEDFQGNGEFHSSFWDTSMNPDVNGIGNGSDPNVIGKTTVEMQDANTFIDAGWDFNTPIWKFCSLPDYPRLGWEECPEAATLLDVVSTMLDPNSLKNSNMKNALINKINAVLQMIDEGLNEEALTKMASVGSVKANRSYNGALNKLENDILAKTDGCAETGEPDKNDWIITCEGQNQVYPLIVETIEYVKSLME